MGANRAVTVGHPTVGNWILLPLPPMTEVRITVDGRRALTVEMIAERYGLEPPSVRSFLKRAALRPVADLGKKKVYDARAVAEARKHSPGRGAHWRRA